MPSPYASLQRTEALARRELLDLTSYDVALDLASDDATFRSVTTLRFSSRAGATFLDLKPVSLAALSLDGRPLDVDLLERGRFPLELTEEITARLQALGYASRAAHRDLGRE